MGAIRVLGGTQLDGAQGPLPYRGYGGVDSAEAAMLPFSHEQFIQVFSSYNTSVWPAPVLAYALAVAMLFAVATGRSKLAGAGLALMWLWTGVAYHWLHFTAINKAAWLFGAVFVLQALLLLLMSARGRLHFTGGTGTTGVIGWGLVLYATVVYPLLGSWTGQSYPAIPTFGITPCPVTVFTFGLLLLAAPPVPRWLLVVPVLWSFVGGTAAFLLHVPQDWVLLLSGLAAIPVLAGSRRPQGHAPHHA
jgi:hypothetical protein